MSHRFSARSFTGAVVVLGLLGILGIGGVSQAAPPGAKQAAEGKFKLSDAQVAEQAAKIDQLVEAGLTKANIRPNGPSSDEVFVRRVHLDVVGRMPTYPEAKAFLDSQHNLRRPRLIDSLLLSPGRASHEFNYWADVLRVTSRLQDGSAEPYVQWVKQAMRENMSYDKFVASMMTAKGRLTENGAAGYFVRDSGMPLDNASNTMRIFLGTQVGCAQCHDHPFDQWTQYEFYEAAAFTYGLDTRVDNETTKQLNAVASQMLGKGRGDEEYRVGRRLQDISRSLAMGVRDNGRQLQLPHDYKYSDAKPHERVPARSIMGEETKGTSREVFAQWLTSKDNPRFAQVIANRYWKRLMGRGVFEPHDEITADTKPVNPELSDHLTQLMKDLDYDLREFQRVILNTKTYQRQAARAEPKADEAYLFPGPLLRRMSAEQVWDSLMALALPEPDASLSPTSDLAAAIDKIDNMTAQQIIDSVTKGDGGMMGAMSMMAMGGYGDDKNGMKRASELPSPAPAGHVLERFGQSDRQLIETASTSGSVPQVLNLMNGWIDKVLLKDQSALYETVKRERSVNSKIDAIWISILGRPATAQERGMAMAEIKSLGDTAFNNLVWAMLNSREFLFIQ